MKDREVTARIVVFFVVFVIAFLVIFVISFLTISSSTAKRKRVDYIYNGERHYAYTQLEVDIPDYALGESAMFALIGGAIFAGGIATTIKESDAPQQENEQSYSEYRPRKKRLEPARKTSRKRRDDSWYDHELEGDHEVEDGWCNDCEEDVDDLD